MNGQTGPVLFPSGPGGVGRVDGTSDLSLWLDAGTIAEIDGDPMVTWDDQSGNDNDALAGTAAPTYVATGGGNRQPAVNFNQGLSEDLYVPTNIEVMPLWEVSVFVAANYENSSDSWGELYFYT